MDNKQSSKEGPPNNNSVDYYDVLGVSIISSPDEIKSAYRKLVLKNHPDKNKDCDSTEKMASINRAYAVLSDPKKRFEYDESVKARKRRESYKESRANYKNMFGGSVQRYVKAPDIILDVNISMKEVIYGVKRELNIEGEKIHLNIPPGVPDGGHFINFQEKGKMPTGNYGDDIITLRGDIIVHVKPEQHPIFKLKGFDLYCSVPVPLHIIMFGGNIKIPTIDGVIDYSLTPITDSKKLNIIFPNKGAVMSSMSGKISTNLMRGKQIVILDIDFPTMTDKDEARKIADSFKSFDYKKTKNFNELLKENFVDKQNTD